jgi:6-phosphogluconolactonase
MEPGLCVYVGTYTEPIRFGTGEVFRGRGQGIHLYRLREATGALEQLASPVASPNPSFLALAPGRRFLYAVNELKSHEGRPTGTVSAFALDPDTGEPRLLNRVVTQGTDPCYLTLDRTGRWLLVANYASGSVCVLPVAADGRLGEASDFVQHHGASVHPERQRGPHAHCVVLDKANRHAFVADLGLDRVMSYRFDPGEGRLEPNEEPWLALSAGAGPRHLVFHPEGRHAYLINELDSTVLVLDYDSRRGTLRAKQTLSTLPEGYGAGSSGAHLEVSPSGRFLYASNRGHDSIAIYRIEGDSGRLSPVGHQPTRGRTPRFFAMDPAGRYLLAANQDSDTVVAFRVDPATGLLEALGPPAQVPTPVCLRVVAGAAVGGAPQ